MQRRGAEDVGAAQAARHLGVVDSPEPFHALVPCGLLAQLGRGRAVARHPDAHVGRQLRHRVEQHGEALARLVPPDEEDRRPVRRPRGRLGKALHLDAVEQQHVVAVERVARGDARVLRDGAPEHQPRREPAHDRA